MSRRLFRALSLVTLAAVTVALIAPVARAAEGKAKKHEWTGTIAAVDAKAGTCTIQKMGKDQKEISKTFECAPDCKVTGAAAMADLKVGEKVTVTYTEQGGKLTCHAMAVKTPKAKAEK